mmetsp:Transcript_30842/g.100733  ORF Transcript_30842/g.100733 Transcript_30842/m.100733 type:complete len:450 (-) Transcript_30842:373-1722(-)
MFGLEGLADDALEPLEVEGPRAPTLAASASTALALKLLLALRAGVEAHVPASPLRLLLRRLPLRPLWVVDVLAAVVGGAGVGVGEHLVRARDELEVALCLLEPRLLPLRPVLVRVPPLGRRVVRLFDLALARPSLDREDRVVVAHLLLRRLLLLREAAPAPPPLPPSLLLLLMPLLLLLLLPLTPLLLLRLLLLLLLRRRLLRQPHKREHLRQLRARGGCREARQRLPAQLGPRDLGGPKRDSEHRPRRERRRAAAAAELDHEGGARVRGCLRVAQTHRLLDGHRLAHWLAPAQPRARVGQEAALERAAREAEVARLRVSHVERPAAGRAGRHLRGRVQGDVLRARSSRAHGRRRRRRADRLARGGRGAFDQRLLNLLPALGQQRSRRGTAPLPPKRDKHPNLCTATRLGRLALLLHRVAAPRLRLSLRKVRAGLLPLPVEELGLSERH